MLPTIAPWVALTPQFYLNAIEAGTAAGARARQQDLDASRADSLREAHLDLMYRYSQARAAAQAQHAASAAADLLRAREPDSLNLSRWRLPAPSPAPLDAQTLQAAVDALRGSRDPFAFLKNKPAPQPGPLDPATAVALLRTPIVDRLPLPAPNPQPAVLSLIPSRRLQLS